MYHAALYEKVSEEKVRCNICQRRCVINEGARGFCRTRINQNGKLYSLIYGRVASWAVSPIEKKPMYHFYPGSYWLSLGSLGCNFRCLGCQNWEIAHSLVDNINRDTQFIPPEEAVEIAKNYGAIGISWTYNEPTLWFEYTLDSAKLAKEKGLLTNYVTNGYITEEALDIIGPYLDSFRVDIKGFSNSFYKEICNISDFTGILNVTKRAKEKWNMHVEIVTNIIPGYNDNETQLELIANWIYKELGKDTPWHVTRFVPYLKLSHLELTPIATLEKAREIGLKAGLRYVYIGNLFGHPGENTYCYQCGGSIIERKGLTVFRMRMKNNSCGYCGAEIAGKF